MPSAAAAAAAAAPGSVPLVRSPLGCTSEAASDAGAFSAWCAEHDVLWPKCRIGATPATGRAMLAAADIAAGEVVVEVPDAAVLMGESCTIQALLAQEGLLKPAEDALLEVQGLVLAVMAERALGAASAWAGYLSFLPADMSHMMTHWSDAEIEELRGTAAHDKWLGHVQHPADAPTRVRQLFDELVLPVVLEHKELAAMLLGATDGANNGSSSSKGKGKGKGKKKQGSKQPGASVSREDAAAALWPDYQWATAAVASYSFVLGDASFQGMVPVWDALNHVTGAANVRLHHDAEKGVLQMIATQPIPAGAEVVNCYGRLTSAELLRGYGYVEPAGGLQHVQVPAHFLLKVAAAAEPRPAAAAAAAAGGGGEEGGQGSGADADEGDDGAAAGGSLSGGASDGSASGASAEGGASSGEDGSGSSSSDEDDDDSEDDEASEPEWDFSDDDDEALEQQQQRQQQSEAALPAVPSLSKARERLADWDERWQLAFSLGLLPKAGVLQLPAGGLAALPGPLLATLLVLLAPAEECQALVAAAMRVTDDAAAAAAAAAVKQQATGQKGKKQRSGDQQPQQQQQAVPGGGGSALTLEAAQQHLAAVQFTSPATLHTAMRLLVALMQSRYSASLAGDRQLLATLDSLAPRLAAAVVARSFEMEVWAELQQALAAPDAATQLMQHARQGLAQALQRLADKAGSSKQRRHHHHHDHNHHDHNHHEHDHHDSDQAAAGGRSGDGGGKGGSKRVRPDGDDSKKSKKQQQPASMKAPQAAGEGFAFNFVL